MASQYDAGGGFGFRNRIINGSALIGQRNTVTSSAVQAIYGTDRMLMGSVAGTSIGLNLLKSALSGSSSGLGHFISGSMTSGLPYWAQRIEASNVIDMNGKTISVSGLLYQDTGSTQNFVARISKANAINNFSAVTQVAQSSAIAVPSGVLTPFEAQFNLGATDASNGFMAEVFSSATITCTSKSFVLSDFQVELGAAAGPFEKRPIGIELLLSQRYGEALAGIVNAPNTYREYYYKVSKFKNPTITNIAFAGGTGATFTSNSTERLYQETAHSTTTTFTAFADAEL